MTMQAQVLRPAATDEDVTSESSQASELDMLLEFTDALADDLPALRSPGGVFAFSFPADLSPPTKPLADLKAATAADAKREKSREKERRKYYRKKVRPAASPPGVRAGD